MSSQRDANNSYYNYHMIDGLYDQQIVKENVDNFTLLILSDNPNPNDIHFSITYNKEKWQILTFEKLK